MPDIWESAHFSNITNESTYGDFDGDGVLNVDEWEDGTIPNAATSRWQRLTFDYPFGHGHATYLPVADRFAPGSTAAVQAVEAGNPFLGWLPLQNTNASVSLVVTQDVTLSAYFQPYPRSVLAWGANGEF